MAAAMLQHAWSQADLVRESRVSDTTIRKMLRGQAENYRSDVLGKVSHALWGDASVIRQILEGESPPSGGNAAEDERGDEVVEAIHRSRRLSVTDKELLLTAYRFAIRTPPSDLDEIDRHVHGSP